MANVSALPILQSGDPLLREVSKPVPEELFGTEELTQMVEQMVVTLDGQPDGVALAAPQVGIPYRIFVVRFDRTKPVVHAEGEVVTEKAAQAQPAPQPEIGIFINPHFTNSSRRRIEMDEGCLSVRSIYGTTLRHERATIRAQDVTGNFFERGGGGLVAQIFQHETDHLNGILFIDHAENLVQVRKKEDGEGYEEIPLSELPLEEISS